MGLVSKLRSVSGIVKNRLASAIGALRATPAGRLVSRVARRIPGPIGIGLSAIAFAPQIRKGLTLGRKSITRGIAFIGGQRVVTAAGAGGFVGILSGRKSGKPDTIIPRAPGIKAKERRIARRKAPTKRKPAKRKTRKRIPAHRHRIVNIPTTRRKSRKKRTHRSPRHRGHKRVSFTTKSGQKVSFLANPKARHR